MKRRSVGPGISFFAFQDIITAVVGIFILITLILVLELAQRVEAATSPPTVDIEQLQTSLASLEAEVEKMQAEFERRMSSQKQLANLNEFNRDAKIAELRYAAQAASERLASAQVENQRADRSLKEAQKAESALLQKSAALADDRELIADLRERLKEMGRRINEIESEDPLIYRDNTADGQYLTLLTLGDGEIELSDALSKKTLRWNGLGRIHQFREWLDHTDLQSRHILLLVRPGGARDFERLQAELEMDHATFGYDVIGTNRTIHMAFEVDESP
ncbi:hypothetical protein [Candidatus Laterigemmans baculatus]|uniref:hypothetical protein n=1 Tax=Candidatus Laterigemmans baculatus TaxID=2770505 RepID=UPI0013DD6F8C|nr:hypothetical protein [Candidatus Laterigemmans baculatus]